jgi:hypothetical protein
LQSYFEIKNNRNLDVIFGIFALLYHEFKNNTEIGVFWFTLKEFLFYKNNSKFIVLFVSFKFKNNSKIGTFSVYFERFYKFNLKFAISLYFHEFTANLVYFFDLFFAIFYMIKRG